MAETTRRTAVISIHRPLLSLSPRRTLASRLLTAVGRSQLLARRPGTLSRILSGIPRAAQTVLDVYLKRILAHPILVRPAH